MTNRIHITIETKASIDKTGAADLANEAVMLLQRRTGLPASASVQVRKVRSDGPVVSDTEHPRDPEGLLG